MGTDPTPDYEKRSWWHALATIASEGCERLTSPGGCRGPNGYARDEWCHQCLAAAALRLPIAQSESRDHEHRWIRFHATRPGLPDGDLCACGLTRPHQHAPTYKGARCEVPGCRFRAEVSG